VIAGLIGAVSIVTSLVFVGLQLRQSEATARAELRQAIGASGIEYQQTFIDSVDVWVSLIEATIATLENRVDQVAHRERPAAPDFIDA
jgi:hypothetical protein